MEAKKVSDSTIEIIQQMTHQDANLAGNVHGGVIMKLVDSTASIVAARHASANVVTASIDRLNFYNPAFIGDLLRIKASLNYVGTTSMEIGVRVESENFITCKKKHIAMAYLTFVALDTDGLPKPVPALILENDDDIRRNREALERKKSRIEEAERRIIE